MPGSQLSISIISGVCEGLFLERHPFLGVAKDRMIEQLLDQSRNRGIRAWFHDKPFLKGEISGFCSFVDPSTAVTHPDEPKRYNVKTKCCAQPGEECLQANQGAWPYHAISAKIMVSSKQHDFRRLLCGFHDVPSWNLGVQPFKVQFHFR